MGETFTKPYLIRALHEWCTDNGYTPYIVVQVDEHTMVPMGHVQDGQITLNVSALATNGLKLGNDFIEFQARFGGRPENVVVHIGAISAIYSRETGAGMGFEVQPYDPAAGALVNADPASAPALADTAVAAPTLDVTDGGRADDPPTSAKRPRLTIVK
jgi:stringent starvation protein B